MKKINLAMLCLLLTAGSYAQEKDFVKYIVKNSEWKETSRTVWNAEVKSDRGSLYYFGAEHLDDPKHPQFDKIKKRWDKVNPTLAFYEGPDRGIAPSDSLTIRKFGESGYLRFLAEQAGVKTRTLEPSPVELYNYLCTKFDQERVDVYMLTKEAMRLRTRKNYSREQIESETVKLLRQFQQMLGEPVKVASLEKLKSSFRSYFDVSMEWWELPASWFDPQQNDARFTNQLAILSSEYRDIHMVKILSDEILKGEIVFAVVGRNHIPLQINAIRYAVGLPLNKRK